MNYRVFEIVIIQALISLFMVGVVGTATSSNFLGNKPTSTEWSQEATNSTLISNPYLTERLGSFDLDLYDFEIKTESGRKNTCRGLRTLVDRKIKYSIGEEGYCKIFSLYDKEVVFAERCLEQRSDLRKAASHAATILNQPLTDESILACYLCCEEMDPSNNWFTLYRSTLPDDVFSVITEEERLDENGIGSSSLSILPNCYICAIKAVQKYIKKQHASCVAAFEAIGLEVPRLENYLRAFALVRSRSFAVSDKFISTPSDQLVWKKYGSLVTQRIKNDVETNTRKVLLPLCDLLNHKTGANLTIHRQNNTWYVLSKDACVSGSEIFNSYGDDLSNLDLLLRYGFCTAGNGHLKIPFDIKDLLKALVATKSNIFGDSSVIQSLHLRLAKEEAERRAKPLQDLALYSMDLITVNDVTIDDTIQIIPSERLRLTLEIFRKTAISLGCTEDKVKTFPSEVLLAMLKGRFSELKTCLKRMQEKDTLECGDYWRDQVVTLLVAEQEAIEKVLTQLKHTASTSGISTMSESKRFRKGWWGWNRRRRN